MSEAGPGRPDDMLVILDDLNRLVDDAPAVPLVGQARLDREHVYDLCDRLRALLPEETRQARWLVKERDEIFRSTKAECGRVLQEARRRAERMLEAEVVNRKAREFAAEVIAEAKGVERAQVLRAEDDADDLLCELQTNLDRALEIVRNSPHSATEGGE